VVGARHVGPFGGISFRQKRREQGGKKAACHRFSLRQYRSSSSRQRSLSSTTSSAL
jgi:hypothetical protein